MSLINKEKWTKCFKRCLLSLIAVSLPAYLLAATSTTASQGLLVKPKTTHTSKTPKEHKQLWNLQNADIHAVIQTISEITGKTFIVDPRVQGKVTIVSTKPMSDDEIYQVFLSMLQVLNYSAVPSGDVIKIIPSTTAKEYGGKVATNKHPGSGDQIVVRVVPVNNVSAVELVPVLRPLMQQAETVTAYTPSNSLIFAGYAANIKRLVDIVHEMDKSNASGITVVPLKHANAQKLTSMITQLQSEEKSKGQVSNISLVADSENNSILLSGNEANRLKTEALIKSLDNSEANGEANTVVVKLNYLTAKDVAPILTKIAHGDLERAAKNKPGAKTASSSDVSSGTGDSTVSIQAEKADNAVIISGPVTMINNLEKVIKEIDIPPQQVLVEAIIVQLDESVANQLGIEWGSRIDTGNVSDQEVSAAIGGDLAAAGLVQGMGFIPGGNIKLLIAALAKNQKANILSTPSILVLNNQQASISNGETVSMINRTYAAQDQSSDDNSYTPFNTLQRQNVALTLKVTPQISPNNMVLLKIDQQDNSLKGDSTSASGTPAENTSSIKTSVLVRSGDILVLGGLLKKNSSGGYSKIPVLGDLPLLGKLFRYRNTSVAKNNLMIFIKPIIVNNSKEADKVTKKRYQYMRYQERKYAAGIRLNDKSQVNPILPGPHKVDRPAGLPTPFGG